MLSKNLIKELTHIIGKENIRTDKEYLICYSYDATNQKFLPDAVVFPKNADEISLILKLANKEGFPVVPRGAGSGFSGGSLPVEGGVVVSLERMNKILKIDADNLIAVVEPGVITGELQWAVEDLGLFYPPDPSSLKFCTMGGNVAECAGGPRAVKYGVTKDYVLGLEVVLPTGDIINTGTQTLKDVVGYDLTKLMVGSEGTLGIVTKIILKLLPLPEATKTMLAVFSDMRDAAATVSRIISSKIIPSTLEFMDKKSISCVDEYASIGLPADVEALLLIEVDGAKELIEKQAEGIKKICLDNRAKEVRIAGDKKEVKKLWQIRRAISPALAKLKPNKINEDIVVPRSKIPDAITGVREIAKKYNLINANFGHAGDGNIHVNIMIDKPVPEGFNQGSDKDEFERAEKAVKEIFELVLDLGGTISGEHGIGISKMPYVGMELSQPAIEVMKKIKQVLDPKGILNPGKIFPQTHQG
ncbi:MAG TPA: FAD-linked oxidase C-terminal domain-containing protein [Thermodesulfobacteriota bacterium]|nr:FAD-linked oxidase C-terminal domain-containing protein [Thermodesulfobacteriota bacterium]